MADIIRDDYLNNIDAFTPPNSIKPISPPDTLGVFGGESYGFSNGIDALYSKSFYSKRAQADGYSVAKGMVNPIPRSIFNQYALFNYRGMHGGLIGDSIFNEYYDQPNNSLMGGYDSKHVTLSRLMEFFNTYYPKISYKPQDFLYSKWYKKIPLNHLITLRRFPLPVNDNIFDLSLRPASKDPSSPFAQKTIDATQVAGVTAVTFLGETAGNNLSDILNFSFGLNWKEIEAEMEEFDVGEFSYTNQPFYTQMGGLGRALADTIKGTPATEKFRRQILNQGDRLGTTYANYVIGPVNVVNKTSVRDTGINFSNDVTLNFEYELKSLNYVNPKIAMIDVISNMLIMATNNAQFYGGGHRYYGSDGYVASQFGDIMKLRNGDFAGYSASVKDDITRGFQRVFADGNGNFTIDSAISGIFDVGKTLFGNVVGSYLSKFAGNIGGMFAAKTFISAEPTGEWHITVGNPLNPIVMMGNMCCESASMQFENSLGYDDFPIGVKFEVQLKHGKPRDKGDIENMFNAGRGRIYAGAADEEDVLNLAGLDVATYGSIKAGNNNIQQSSQTGSVVNGTSPRNVRNNSLTNLKNKADSLVNKAEDVSSREISNIVSMFVES